jgi:hypothetical protein
VFSRLTSHEPAHFGAVGEGPLSQVRPDQSLRKLDHRGHVTEADLLPPVVSGGGTQSGRGAPRVIAGSDMDFTSLTFFA